MTRLSIPLVLLLAAGCTPDATDTGKAPPADSDTGAVDSDTGSVDTDTGTVDSDTGTVDSDTGTADSDTDTGTVDSDTDTGTVDSDTDTDTGSVDSDTGTVDSDTGSVDSDTGSVDSDTNVDTSDSGPTDADADGYDATEDCDDADASVHPGAVETCDGVDTNCSGDEDDATDPTPTYTDADADGYGDAGTALTSCTPPADAVTVAGDCDDADADFHPGATEPCDDPADYNCDGSTGYADADGDGWAACEECDDTDAAINPDATEVCDDADVDEDCSGDADDADAGVDPATLTDWYRDADNDGYGDVTALHLAQCEAPTGYASAVGDCDNYDATRNPGALERCDDADVDEDCDGTADDLDASTDAASWVTWYADSDHDGYGNPARTVSQCEAPSGHVATGTDCDDTAASVNPAAAEVCDAADKDEDCDGAADDADPGATGATPWYADADGDSYGDPASATLACDLPAGHVDDATDCDDGAASIHPGAAELCDAADTDEDCDGATDDADPSATGQGTWYLDADLDSYGTTTSIHTCDRPSGYAAAGGDCDDADDGVNPAASEVCDAANTDEDCDGLADNSDPGATGTLTWYRDADADGYGSATTTRAACDVPSGYVADATDCNDASGAVNPAATEVCDAANVDEDCDGLADNADPSATGGATVWRDADGDSYGDAAHPLVACDSTSGYVGNDDDCDDSAATIKPGATEVCDAANTDEDCDGAPDDSDTSAAGKSTWYRDLDSDGYGTSTSTTTACDLPAGYAATSTDCDDTSAARSPGLAEVCDAANVDEDCDGSADDSDSSVTGKTTWYRDVDADGWGGSTTSSSKCDMPSGYVATNSDCNDASSAINPGATEVCDVANTDEDCDGAADDADSAASGKSTWYQDADGDTYGGSVSRTACESATGWVTSTTDCDDTKASVHPGATETCDGIDQDCDAVADDGLPLWYPDYDGDAFGDVLGESSCSYVPGLVADNTDCDETDPAINPGAAEVCDLVDNDCDDAIDDEDSDLDATMYYADADLDGYGDAGSTLAACSEPDGYVSDAEDCDDGDPDVNPGADELYGDTVDDDCDGSTAITYTCPADGVTVCSSGCDRTSVADAITYSTSGSTICIEASTWTENIDVTGYNDLTIQGRGRTQTTLAGGIRVRPYYDNVVTIRGLHITGATSSAYGSVYIQDVNTSADPTVILEDCEIDAPYNGVSLVRSANGAGDYTVRNCDIDTTGTTAAIYILDSDGDGTTWNLTIENNYLHDSFYGIRASLSESAGEHVNAYVYNNTFYNDTAGVYWVSSGLEYSILYAYNNLFSTMGYSLYGSLSANAKSYVDYNLFYNYSSAYDGVSGGAHDLSANPLLDVSYAPPRLGAGSPAIGAASASYGLSTDHWGTPRGSAYDIGAVEY